MMRLSLTPANTCPTSGMSGCFVGRVWLPGDSGGPTPVLVTDEGVFDISSVSPTLSGLLAADDPYAAARSGKGRELGDVTDILANTAFQDHNPDKPYFLAPVELHALKACGVTFVRSMLERVIEEQAEGNPDQAAEVRNLISTEIGQSLADGVPGSAAAAPRKHFMATLQEASGGETGKQKPDGFDVLGLAGDIGALVVKEEANAAAELLPFLAVLENRFPAGFVEGPNAVGLDSLLALDAQLFLDLNFDRPGGNEAVPSSALHRILSYRFL